MRRPAASRPAPAHQPGTDLEGGERELRRPDRFLEEVEFGAHLPPFGEVDRDFAARPLRLVAPEHQAPSIFERLERGESHSQAANPEGLPRGLLRDLDRPAKERSVEILGGREYTA